MKVAVIGIGSNSVRMLLAEIGDGVIRRQRRDRAGTRLFAGLDKDRRLSREAIDRTCEAVTRMADSARADGAEVIHLFATSATRDAANKEEFAGELQRRAGLTLEICSGEEEAVLSFLGAAEAGEAGVIDIGGGSTEVIVGDGQLIFCAFSCQMGAVRLSRLLPIRDHGDLPHVESAAAEILREQLRAHPVLSVPENWYGTGGTFTTLAAMIRGVHWTERTFMHGTEITLENVERVARQLADMPVEERRLLPGLQPNRADIIVHGLCILLACMKTLGISRISVSEFGNLDGYMKRRYGSK